MDNRKVAAVLFFIVSFVFAVAAFLKYRDQDFNLVMIFSGISSLIFILGLINMFRHSRNREGLENHRRRS